MLVRFVGCLGQVCLLGDVGCLGKVGLLGYKGQLGQPGQTIKTRKLSKISKTSKTRQIRQEIKLTFVEFLASPDSWKEGKQGRPSCFFRIK